MNEAKLKRLINDTSDLLNLNEAGKKYLDVTINMVYTMGRLDENRERKTHEEELDQRTIAGEVGNMEEALGMEMEK